MNSKGLNDELTLVLKNYWRMRCGLSAYKAFSNVSSVTTSISYRDIPKFEEFQLDLKSESMASSLTAVNDYIKSGRLCLDVFYSLISSFESFLSTKLRAKSLSDQGTHFINRTI